MNTHISDLELDLHLIDAVVAAGIRGGQKADGSQRDGIFQYSDGRPVEVFDLASGHYNKLPDLKELLGPLPEGHAPWKALVKDTSKASKLQVYFNHLFASETFGAKLAQQFALESNQFAKELVQSGVASSDEDVNLVLQNGFAHLYGPINSYY
jgi:hypothetical protein